MGGTVGKSLPLSRGENCLYRGTMDKVLDPAEFLHYGALAWNGRFQSEFQHWKLLLIWSSAIHGLPNTLHQKP